MTQPISLDMIRESLYSAVICDCLDAAGFPNQSPRCQWQPYGVTGVLAGRCKTTLWVDMYHEITNPYELELRAVDSCQTDDLLIAAAANSTRSAVWGELLSTASRNRGCAGAIIDGLTRDTTKTTAMGFPVFARGTSPYDSQNRQRVVDLDIPVQIESVTFRPGDLVVADADGIVVVPSEVEAEVLLAAWDKVHTENEIRAAIAAGMSAQAAYDKFGVL